MKAFVTLSANKFEPILICTCTLMLIVKSRETKQNKIQPEGGDPVILQPSVSGFYPLVERSG